MPSNRKTACHINHRCMFFSGEEKRKKEMFPPSGNFVRDFIECKFYRRKVFFIFLIIEDRRFIVGHLKLGSSFEGESIKSPVKIICSLTAHR